MLAYILNRFHRTISLYNLFICYWMEPGTEEQNSGDDMNFIKFLFIVLGTISLIIGIIGIVIPGLPATPFFLLTAVLYIKSSDKLYQKLIGNKIIGSYILEFHRKKGMTRKSKLSAIAIMWVMIAISCIFLINPFAIKVIVAVIGVIGTIIMGFIIPTVSIPDSKSTLSGT